MIDTMIRKALEARIAAQGLDWLKVRHLELRSADKCLVVEIDLDGEPAPVRATAHYRLAGSDLVIESVETSKKWLTEVARLALARHGGTIELPGGLVGTMARALL